MAYPRIRRSSYRHKDQEEIRTLLNKDLKKNDYEEGTLLDHHFVTSNKTIKNIRKRVYALAFYKKEGYNKYTSIRRRVK